MQGSVKYSVNGGRVEYNNFDVDGQDVLNAGVNGSQSTLIVYPSLDALAEVQVLTVCVRSGEFLLFIERVYADHLHEWMRTTAADFT